MAEQRAIRFAQQNGTLVIAAEGNFRDDLAHPTQDVTSPDFPIGSEVERAVTNACIDIPAEIPGVVSVTASGNRVQKSFYSSYGIGVTDVIARVGTPSCSTPRRTFRTGGSCRPGRRHSSTTAWPRAGSSTRTGPCTATSRGRRWPPRTPWGSRP